MKILVTNDDGVFADGIKNLAKSLSEVGEVYVIAPNRQRSASGHSITMHKPLRAEKVNFFDTDIPAWAVSGTPSDCVKLGIEAIMKEKPDIVFSGINKGANLGTDVLYSGTVSAAIEGAMFGLPSIAVSLQYGKEMDFTYAADFSKKISKMVYHKKLPVDTLININFPNSKKINDVKITTLGVRRYKNSFVERIDPHGNSYYWMGGEALDENNGEKTDIWAVKNNYVSITPIHFDITNYQLIEQLKDWKIDI